MTATFSVSLPLAQENFTRTFHLVDGENVIWIDSEVENLLSFDRPVFWGEHATISAPFLEPGKVVVDMPVTKAKTKAHGMQPNHSAVEGLCRLHLADGADARRRDVRRPCGSDGTRHDRSHYVPSLDPSGACVCDGAARGKKLLIGWVFRREEYPWLQTWLSSPVRAE